ncbi:MAG: hypothetical protein HRT95_05525 [Moritella sp.]|uniref:hypothetical protein n=1 Tax=Moritella sp. TaxID=78556 RepID=UPI001D62F8E5|nr:hypothetical protein [Moritella sp.]NQZ49650.1 hypothetical protein [Moritella sp.]
MNESLTITKLDISNDKIDESCNAVFVNGRLIAVSSSECTMATVDSVAYELQNALQGYAFTSIELKSDDNPADFDFNAFQTALYEVCHHSVCDYQAMPMDFEFNGVVFEFDEFILFLTNIQHKQLSKKICQTVSK